MQPNKKIYLGDGSRWRIKKGVDCVVEPVKITLGPRGKNVAIQRIGLDPVITNDGVSIANAIKVEDQGYQMGVEMARATARKTDAIAGDGTTTTLVLYQALLEEGMERLDVVKSVMNFKKGMDKAKDYILRQLEERTKQISTLEEIKEVAMISVENEKIAEMISNTLYKVGKDGNIIVEETEKPDIYVEMQDGYTVDRGFASPYIINNHAKQTGEYVNARVLVTDRKLMTSENLIDLIKKMQAIGEGNLIIVADDIDGEMLVSAQMTHNEGLFNIIPVRFPCYSADRIELLNDIAVRCGTKVYGQGKIKDLKELEVDDLGQVRKVVVKKDSTMLIGSPSTEAYDDYVTALYQRIQDEISEDNKKFLNYRISNLMNKTAVVKVGALTEQERKYYRLKIDDAINATRGAMEEGVVEGGGYTLASISSQSVFSTEDRDTELGFETVIEACKYPYATILMNSGAYEYAPEKWTWQWFKELFYPVKRNKIERFDASTGEYVDNTLFDVGVVDPVKVTKNALINAVSGASLFLTMDASVQFEKEYKPEN